MSPCRCVTLTLTLVLLQINPLNGLYLTKHRDSLHHVLSEFEVFRPLSTNSDGRFVSHSVSSPLLVTRPRSKRHAHHADLPPRVGGVARSEGSAHHRQTLFYNVTIFGRELHLRLQRNSRLVAPGATVEWEEESGEMVSHPLEDNACYYSGDITNLEDTEDTAVALSNCGGLAGMIRLGNEKFFIEPLEQHNGGESRKEEREKEVGQDHVVYRSSAVIKHPTAVNQNSNDFLRDLEILKLKQNDWRSNAARIRRQAEQNELYNVEVLLGVDYSVLLFHGRDHIQQYLLTLMNIVNEIYQDRSLGANINIILVRIIILSASKSQELIEVWNPSQSLEKVCRWAFLQQRGEQSHTEHHDHAIYITRQEFGPSGMQGYAPVTGMCHSVRSCTLNLEDGFSSAFVVAHETGHVLGMEHDGQGNDCADEVPLGSIMSPLVQAAFHRYHWSRCSRQELSQHLHTYDCLRDDPFNHDWPKEPQLPGLHISMDQQCRFDFGSDFRTCTAYSMYDPCKQLWCSHHDNPFFCKTKKSPPIDGTKCGAGKSCFKGYCLHLTPDLLRQDGSWAGWSSFGSCSRTCGGGVQFRTRHCTSPPPANGGRPCIGNHFEFQLCNLEECSSLSDYRAEQCQIWDQIFEHNGTKHHWLPYENPEADDICELYCQSLETGEVVSMETQVHDGTRCSYNDPYSVCVTGECEHVGCDHQVASDKQEDRCGICGGDNSSCQVIKGNFTRSAKKQGYLKILEIPEGARHLVVQEQRASPHVIALKNQGSGVIFLNHEHQLPQSRVVIERGVAWNYNNQEDRETVQTSGPLRYKVLIMMRSHGEAKVTVTYKYVVQESMTTSIENNQLHDDTVFYQWALKKWSNCSKPCGGGKQYTRFGCRRKADGKMVHRYFCSSINKPRAISRWCNTLPCPTASWVTGEWGACSASCGQTGYESRWVRCQQRSKEGQSFVSSRMCEEERPAGRRTCGRTPCPLSWRTGPWSQCSVTCGNGTEQRQVLCGSQQNSSSCKEPKPSSSRSCHLLSCDQRNPNIHWLSRSAPEYPQPSPRQRCRGDQSVFCRLQVLSRYCSMPKYRQMCCKSCSHGNFTSMDVTMTTEPSPRFGSSTTDAAPCSTTGGTTSVIPATTTGGTTSVIPATTTGGTTSVIPATTTGGTTSVIPATTTGGTTDFMYVYFEDYEEYSAGEGGGASGEGSGASERTTATPTKPSETEASFTTTQVMKISSPVPSPWVATVTHDTQGPTLLSVRFLGTQAPPFPSLGTMTTPPSLHWKEEKKDNNSVDEVSYRVVGLDTDVSKSHQNYFVPRMPPFRERTQNKRIQQLLNEKRRKDVLRPGRTTDPIRTHSRNTSKQPHTHT